ncbi:hypothetical protein AMJ74_06400 [candidate division WOR_3 bacterium SM1_77]|uniref:Uncharacterized protein n=1 Tax=candidate division WOR_3 bacterium SM1_77 TaxID=1703778 RepID=A0A0S8JV88_UNCW3|nr:MAG: hypothetical protein AMJ74_06400 [candidate division WOR_3 bacterium SM1_77]
MTAQIDDIFRYNDTDYSVVGISEGELFEPSALDLRPVGTCTACWRGYQAIFAVSDSRLTLDTLHVSLLTEDEEMERQEGPTINGVTPTGPQGEYDWFDNHYVGLGYHLEYTGGLLLADGFIDDLYEHMGFHPAWKYTRVVELVFSNGILQKEFDRSDRMAEVRQKILDSRSDRNSLRMLSNDEIRACVERSFDRTYNM